jgi:hypothetical protein
MKNSNNGQTAYGESRLLSGPEAAVAAQQIAREAENRQQWPYEWRYPPLKSIRREPAGSIVAPAVATVTQILAFTVPQGFSYVWEGLLLTYDGGAFVPGSGDIVWSVDVDTPIGITSLANAPLADLQRILFPRGSFGGGPWKLAKAETLKAGQTLRAKVTTTGTITPGAPNYFSALFGGWLIPAVR